MNDLKQGLMASEQRTASSPLLQKFRAGLAPASATPLTLEQRLSGLSEVDMNTIMQTAQFVQMAMQMRIASNNRTMGYADLLKSMYGRMSYSRRSLISELLDEIDPLDFTPAPKQSADETGLSLYDRPEYQLSPQPTTSQADEKTVSALQSALAETLAKQTKQPSGSTGNDAFLAKLTQSESSFNSQAEITIKDGRRFVGSLQFGSARLTDFKKHSGKRFTQDEFKADEALQAEVADWHIADIDKSIDGLGDVAKNFDRDGLRSVAHLGGLGGMKKFVRSGGKHNPADQLGTSLKDYYDKFSS